MSLEAVLDSLGIQYQATTSGNQMIRCPSAEHEDRQRSCSLNLGKQAFSCKACPAQGGPIQLLMTAEGVDREAALRKFEKVTGAGYRGSSSEPVRSRRVASGDGYRPRFKRPPPTTRRHWDGT